MDFESLGSGFVGWCFWVLVFALLLGGRPWPFPANGKILLEQMKLRESPAIQVSGGTR